MQIEYININIRKKNKIKKVLKSGNISSKSEYIILRSNIIRHASG